MNPEILQLEPKDLWKNFAKLNAVPRASKKEERVIAFMKEFGENLGFETMVDEVGNVDYVGFIKDSIQLNSYLELLANNPPDTTTWDRNVKRGK